MVLEQTSTGAQGVGGFMSHAEVMNVTKELVKRGYNEDDIIKIWGGNIMRVWRDVEKYGQDK